MDRNTVTCGHCGKIQEMPMMHYEGEYTCIYCDFTSEPCDFPDYIHVVTEEERTHVTYMSQRCEGLREMIRRNGIDDTVKELILRPEYFIYDSKDGYCDVWVLNPLKFTGQLNLF